MLPSTDYNRPGTGSAYVAGRSLSAETLARWMDAVAPWLPGSVAPRILDLGCGTGRFTGPLVERFGGTVVGADPSREMLTTAGESTVPLGIPLVCARAEALPFPDDSFDLVFASMVYHHFIDRAPALGEARRVLKFGGRLLVRQASRENLAQQEWLRFFPEAQTLEEARIPTAAEIRGEMADVGFHLCPQPTVTHQFAATYAEYAERIGRRALSTLQLISDEAFEAGMSCFRSWCQERSQETPAEEQIDLFVGQK